MFDDLRNSSEDQPIFTADESDAELEAFLKKKPRSSGFSGFKVNGNTLFGMNAFQRFVISALIFVLVLVLGSMLLLITSNFAVY
ncbi:MAG TPA: hypothetical protein VGK00_02970 [Anaerolineales bacterium]|jgi:hypothetical protein